MQLFGEPLVRVRLNAQGFVYGQDFEQEGQSVAVSVADVFAEKRLIVDNQVQQGPLGRHILGR